MINTTGSEKKYFWLIGGGYREKHACNFVKVCGRFLKSIILMWDDASIHKAQYYYTVLATATVLSIYCSNI